MDGESTAASQDFTVDVLYLISVAHSMNLEGGCFKNKIWFIKFAMCKSEIKEV